MSRYGIKPRIGSMPQNPLLRGCTSLFALQYGESHPFDLVNNLLLTSITATPTTQSSPVGKALRTAANQASQWAVAPVRMQSTSGSIMWFGQFLGAPSNDGCLGGITHNSTNASPFVSLELKRLSDGRVFLGTNNGANQRTLNSVGTLTTGVIAVIGTRIPGDQRLYMSGFAPVSAVDAGSIGYGTSPRIEIGDSLNGRNPNSECWMMATWNRAISEAEANTIIADPIALLRNKPSRRAYSIPSGSVFKPWFAPTTSVVYGYGAA